MGSFKTRLLSIAAVVAIVACGGAAQAPAPAGGNPAKTEATPAPAVTTPAATTAAPVVTTAPKPVVSYTGMQKVSTSAGSFYIPSAWIALKLDPMTPAEAAAAAAAGGDAARIEAVRALVPAGVTAVVLDPNPAASIEGNLLAEALPLPLTVEAYATLAMRHLKDLPGATDFATSPLMRTDAGEPMLALSYSISGKTAVTYVIVSNSVAHLLTLNADTAHQAAQAALFERIGKSLTAK